MRASSRQGRAAPERNVPRHRRGGQTIGRMFRVPDGPDFIPISRFRDCAGADAHAALPGDALDAAADVTQRESATRPTPPTPFVSAKGSSQSQKPWVPPPVPMSTGDGSPRTPIGDEMSVESGPTPRRLKKDRQEPAYHQVTSCLATQFPFVLFAVNPNFRTGSKREGVCTMERPSWIPKYAGTGAFDEVPCVEWTIPRRLLAAGQKPASVWVAICPKTLLKRDRKRGDPTLDDVKAALKPTGPGGQCLPLPFAFERLGERQACLEQVTKCLDVLVDYVPPGGTRDPVYAATRPEAGDEPLVIAAKLLLTPCSNANVINAYVCSGEEGPFLESFPAGADAGEGRRILTGIDGQIVIHCPVAYSPRAVGAACEEVLRGVFGKWVMVHRSTMWSDKSFHFQVHDDSTVPALNKGILKWMKGAKVPLTTVGRTVAVHLYAMSVNSRRGRSVIGASKPVIFVDEAEKAMWAGSIFAEVRSVSDVLVQRAAPQPLLSAPVWSSWGTQYAGGLRSVWTALQTMYIHDSDGVRNVHRIDVVVHPDTFSSHQVYGIITNLDGVDTLTGVTVDSASNTRGPVALTTGKLFEQVAFHIGVPSCV